MSRTIEVVSTPKQLQQLQQQKQKQQQQQQQEPYDISKEGNILLDPGNHDPSHFKSKMSKIRFQFRQYMTKFTDHQSEYLAEWQRKHSSPFRDYFFPYTALMGSHTFYVIFLPMPVWFGYFEQTRDLVYILGYSIYLSGFLKDYWCLPRPKSPPVKRSTLSKYTAKEYGAPSSHSANAMGATMYFIYYIWDCSSFNIFLKMCYTGFAILYYMTLVIGRIYCGMHGFLDIISGSICGAVCFGTRMWLRYIFRDFRSGEYVSFPVISVTIGLLLLYKHVKPIDECPCFVDSVAFIGVISGYEVGDWVLQRYNMDLYCSKFNQIGMSIILRPLIAVPFIIIWKELLSKKIIYTFLTKVLRLTDDRASVIKKRKEMTNSHECTPYIGEPKIEILGRFLIYSGIPMITIILAPLVFRMIGIK
ncbi:hypothetical protein RI543_003450 [Arxiozyma heterogenica]|uniref:Phosphatidic acid phosphatase type 2/haloperoxidase domain-containing protein n=1 Tax=Arxiozyma heterogenica TaxID=278026 RepID=A0AAN7WGK8_9SACH|nr:hypothetical protein RI543_003450 [Kazachstania heterogenica]